MPYIEDVRDIVLCAVRLVVDEPEAISLTIESQNGFIVLHLRVAPGDLGKVIGKRGRMAGALRTILTAASKTSREKISLHIEENL